MGFWSSLLKYGGKAARGTGHVIGVTGKTLGSAALHPQRTLMGAGKAMQTAAVGSAAGYDMGEADHRQERGTHRR